MMIAGKRIDFIEGFDCSYQINEKGEINLMNYCCPEAGYYPTLSKRLGRGGYYTVRLSKEGRSYTKYLHRLLAEHFIPNPERKKFIDHRDGNKLRNSINNLRWVTHSENIKSAYDLGLLTKENTYKQVLDLQTGRVYKSIKEASKYTGIKYSTLKNLLNGNRNNKTKLKLLSKPVF